MKKSTTDAPGQDLASRQVLAILADQWTVLVIHNLGREVRRYSELQRMLPDISPKMLTQTLRKLERDGIVERKVYPLVPPRTEYRLTSLGRSLLEPLHMLCVWSQDHAGEVAKARGKFERRYAAAK